jgi:hypothetical protein
MCVALCGMCTSLRGGRELTWLTHPQPLLTISRQSLDCIGMCQAGAAEAWRVLKPDGALVSVTCRVQQERVDAIGAWFTTAAPVRPVWDEGPRAPCPTYCIVAFTRRPEVCVKP